MDMEKLQCVSELFPTRNSVKECAGNKEKAGRVPLRVRLGRRVEAVVEDGEGGEFLRRN